MEADRQFLARGIPAQHPGLDLDLDRIAFRGFDLLDGEQRAGRQAALVAVDWLKSQIIPYATATRCRFWRPIAFPVTVEAGLVIERIGDTSATYGVALFAEGDDRPAATGQWVHVWVDRDEERPVGIPAHERALAAALDVIAARLRCASIAARTAPRAHLTNVESFLTDV